MGIPKDEIDALDKAMLRQKTSLRHFKLMAKTNKMFIPLLKLSVCLTEEDRHQFELVFTTLQGLEKSLSEAAQEPIEEE